MIRDLVEAYPELAAVAVLVLGILLGKLSERAVRRLLDFGNRLVGRYASHDRHLVSPAFQQAFALLVFATVVALAVIISVRLLDIPELRSWLETLLAYVPRFLLGLFIIGIGNIVGVLLRNLAASVLAGGDSDTLLPRLVHAGVVVVAVITGLQQLGINISFVTQLSLIVLASLLGALSVAFALGARQYVANLVAQSELSRYSTGDTLRIDDCEGVIVEIYRTGLTLATEKGQVSIPAARLASGPVVRVTDPPTGD